MKPSQESYVPSYPDFVVEFSPGEFNSGLRTKKEFEAGDFLVKFEGLTKAEVKTYTSVQCGRGPEDHIELNSDLVYINHSCEPNVAFNLSSTDPEKWHIRALKRIEIGDPLTFFYPSTEWDMAQAFDCQCGTPSCLGIIKGAAYLSIDELNARGFVNEWILKLVGEREGFANETAGVRRSPARVGGKCMNCGYGFSAGDDDLERCGCKATTVV